MLGTSHGDKDTVLLELPSCSLISLGLPPAQLSGGTVRRKLPSTLRLPKKRGPQREG